MAKDKIFDTGSVGWFIGKRSDGSVVIESETEHSCDDDAPSLGPIIADLTLSADRVADLVVFLSAGWQSIETAPKDGSMVCCWAPKWDHPIFLIWKTNQRIAAARKRGQDCEDMLDNYFGDPCEHDDYGFARPNGGPTHWFPIQEPPVETFEERFRREFARQNSGGKLVGSAS